MAKELVNSFNNFVFLGSHFHIKTPFAGVANKIKNTIAAKITIFIAFYQYFVMMSFKPGRSFKLAYKFGLPIPFLVKSGPINITTKRVEERQLTIPDKITMLKHIAVQAKQETV